MLQSPAQAPVLDHTYFARRRRARSGPARGQTRIPDWVWGAGLGLIVLLFAGGFFIVSGATGGGGGGDCDEPLAPLQTSDLSASGFAQEDAGMGQVIDFLSRGDGGGAVTVWFGNVHNFTHNAQPQIFEADKELGKNLCEAVLTLENDLDGPSGAVATPQSAAHATTVRDLLRDGAEALGFPRPGE